MRFILTLAFFMVANIAIAASPEPSVFHTFTNKSGLEMRARILAISDDHRSIQIERIDGEMFAFEITLLSLADQSFIKGWLEPKGEGSVNLGGLVKGRIRGFGKLPSGEEIDVSSAAEITDFVKLGARKPGWIAQRENGEIMSSSPGWEEMGVVTDFYTNTVWFAAVKPDGTIWKGPQRPEKPEIQNATLAADGSGHQMAVLDDGSVRVWGNRYEQEDAFEPPFGMSEVVDVATVQSAAGAVTADGKTYCWNTESLEMKMRDDPDGVVQLEGSIFNFIALTKSGQVLEWNGIRVDQAKKSSVLPEGEKFIQVKCSGVTKAAQKEDGTWIAWGAGGAGIIEHINQLGPTPEIAFFSEPNKADYGYVVWIEPEG